MADVPDHRGFDEMYVGVPPWDIGSAQPEVVRIADAGGFTGAVIDVGCGTGENALELSARGLPVVGVDAAPRAIEKARAKALERGSSAEFLVADVFSLDRLGRRFDTALDCGLFHVFEDRERPMYVASLASVLGPGAVLHLLCFSDQQPGDMGPRRVSQQAALAIPSPTAGTWWRSSRPRSWRACPEAERRPGAPPSPVSGNARTRPAQRGEAVTTS